MIPVKALSLEHDVGNDGKDGQRDALLNDLQLNKREGSSVADESHAVGRYLTAVFKKCYSP